MISELSTAQNTNEGIQRDCGPVVNSKVLFWGIMLWVCVQLVPLLFINVQEFTWLI